MSFYKARTVAYGASKVAGDISAVSGKGAQDFRGAMYGVAKQMGDASAFARKGEFVRTGIGGAKEGASGGRVAARASGYVARSAQLYRLNDLPPIARRVIQRSVGAEMNKIRSHGFSSGGKTFDKQNIKKVFDNLNIVFVKIEHVNQQALMSAFTSPELVTLMEKVGQQILNDIRANAPGESYPQSFTLSSSRLAGNIPMVSIVTNDFVKGKYLEYGTIKMKPRPTIRNAVRRAGGMVPITGKGSEIK